MTYLWEAIKFGYKREPVLMMGVGMALIAATIAIIERLYLLFIGT